MISLRTGPRPDVRDAQVERVADVTELLSDCHDRIRHFTTVAVRLARSREVSPRLIADTASALRRYFGTALPLHERDEEECVAPRLLATTQSREIQHVLARMAGDHRAIDEVVVTLDDLWARVLARPSALPALADTMDARSRTLASLFESHLRLEEENIWPAVAQLPESTRALMVREIRVRRASGTVSIPRSDPET